MYHRASLKAQWVKTLPAMQETQERQVQYLDEKEVATHSGILAWEILRTKEPGGI